jgi:hypothetical protein
MGELSDSLTTGFSRFNALFSFIALSPLYPVSGWLIGTHLVASR